MERNDKLNLLLKKVDILNTKHEFKPGQVVKWKKGLRNKLYPDFEQPAVVIETLSTPILIEKVNSGSPYFSEPLDLVLAILDEEDDLIIFHYDSRRFEPYFFLLAS